MSLEAIATIIIGLLLGLGIGIVVFKRVPKKLKTDYFQDQWRELQGYCRDKQTWSQALTEADKLLDKALKKRRFKGRSMGERLVSAQRVFSYNDDIWSAHNLVKKIRERGDGIHLSETDVKDALISFRNALKELGALPSEKRSKQ